MNKFFRVLFLTSIIFNITFIIQDDDEMINALKGQIFKLEEKVTDLRKENLRLKSSDRLNLKQAAIKKTPLQFKESIKSATKKTFKEQMPKEEDDLLEAEEVMLEEKKYQEESEKFYKQAAQRIEEFLDVKVGLTPDQLDLYSFLKEQRAKDIDQFIKKRLEEQQKDGNSTLMLSMEDTIEIGKINQNYLNRFKKNIGPEAYERYRKFKREFNHEMASDPDNMFPFIVEF
jgi:hypothetical protein